MSSFVLPERLEASEPPRARDDVRLMVATRATTELEHATFAELPLFLRAGDVLVVNTSATEPAAIAGRAFEGRDEVCVHVSGPAPSLPADWWVIELRTPDGAHPLPGTRHPGFVVTLDGGAAAELVAPYAGGTRLWIAKVRGTASLHAHLREHGRPIRYGYVPDRWPLADYQTVFARDDEVFGSAEMPSAARPFTPSLVTRLVAAGVLVAPLTLHTGVSSPERHETPYPERFSVPASTARLVNAARAWGGRVIAVGTTAVRALETVADDDGTVAAGHGWTSLVVDGQRPVRVVDGLITGWHEPEASHLDMLETVAGPELLEASYEEALSRGYRWHEFGDSHLILPS